MFDAAKNILTRLRSWVSLNSQIGDFKFVNNYISIRSNEPHLGISLGNTFTYVSIMEDNKAKLIKKAPSFAVFSSNEPVQYSLVTHGVKQLLGIKYEDPLVQKEMKRDPFLKEIVRGPDGYAWFKSATGILHEPSGLLASVLHPMREDVESYLGMPVSKAVVALPSGYNGSQVNAVLDVCDDAGLCLVQSVDEATAAGIAYGMHKEKEGTVFAVVNMGGRTFHVSVLEVDANGKFVSKGVPKSDVFLGGVEFDNVLTEFICKELKRIEGLDLDRNPDLLKLRMEALSRFTMTAEAVKRDLSSVSAVSLPFQVPTILTRNEFERLVTNLIDRVKAHCVNCLKDAHITSKDVDQVLLVGGMANMPIVQKAVIEVFGKSPRTGVSPEEAVSLGAAAAIQAGVLREDDWGFLEMSRNCEAG